MKIRLKFLGTLQYDLNQDETEWQLTLKSTTIKGIISELIQDSRYKELKTFFHKSLEVKRSLLIFLNDQEISTLQGVETKLKDGDKLTFIPVIHGGGELILYSNSKKK